MVPSGFSMMIVSSRGRFEMVPWANAVMLSSIALAASARARRMLMFASLGVWRLSRVYFCSTTLAHYPRWVNDDADIYQLN